MEEKITDDELNNFLKTLGIEKPIPQKSVPLDEENKIYITEESLDKLLDEIMEANQKPSSSPPADLSPPLPLLEEKERQTKRLPIMTLWLSISILGAFFLGSIFGFFWGHTPPRSQPSTMTVEAQLEAIRTGLEKIEQRLEPAMPQREIIQPIDSPLQLTPEALR